MSCNRPNIYGAFNPFGLVQRGWGRPGYGGGYGCSGWIVNTETDYAMGYGVGPGQAIPDIVHRGPIQTQTALGSYFRNDIEREKKHDEKQARKNNITIYVITAIVAVLFAVLIKLFVF